MPNSDHYARLELSCTHEFKSYIDRVAKKQEITLSSLIVGAAAKVLDYPEEQAIAEKKPVGRRPGYNDEPKKRRKKTR